MLHSIKRKLIKIKVREREREREREKVGESRRKRE